MISSTLRRGGFGLPRVTQANAAPPPLPRAAVSLAAFCTSLALLLICGASAQAAFKYEFSNTFDVGQAQGPHPESIAVDNSTNPADPSAGDIYVTDGEVVNKFTPAAAAAGSATPESQLTGFKFAVGVAVDPANGDVFVADIDEPNGFKKFSPSGVQLPFEVKGVSIQYPGGIAVDPVNGNVFIYRGGGNVYELTPSGEYTGNAYQSTGANGVAVDSSGNVYVSSGGNGAEKFTEPGSRYQSLPVSEGSQIAVEPENNDVFIAGQSKIVELDPAGNQIGEAIGSGHLSQDEGVAVNRDGSDVYATEYGPDRADLFVGRIIPNVTVDPPTNETSTSVTLNGHVQLPGGGEITQCAFEYVDNADFNHNGYAEAKTIACEPNAPYTNEAHVAANLSGLTTETTYHYRLVAANATGPSTSDDQTYTPHAVVGLRTDPPTNIAATSATLNGSFIGNGEATKYYFQWGANTAYGHQTPLEVVSPPEHERTSFSFTLTDLNPASSYHYRIVATNGVGTSDGEDRSLSTPRSAPLITESVTGVQSDLAVLHARINPGGVDTTYHFEYGTAPCSAEPDPCKTPTPGEEIDIGSGVNYQSASAPLSGLTAGTTYYYRVIATNAIETTDGPESTFETFSFLPFHDPCPNAHVRQQTGAALLPDCRAYELVSAANSGGYNVESDLTEGQTPYAGYPEAENPLDPKASARVLYAVHDGGIPGTDNPTNRGPDPYIATRGENGWTTEYVGVPANNPFSAAPFTSIPSAADASLETFAFGAPGGCSPCFAGGYTGIPVHLPGSKEVIQGMVAAKGVPTPPPSAKADGYIAKDLSADGEHLIFGSTSKFAEGGNSGGPVSIYDRNLTTEETHVVSNAPGGGPLPCLQDAGEGECHAPKDSNGIAELDISSDGTHVLLGQKVETDADHNVYWHLYMNVGDSEKTIALTPGATGNTGGVLFDGMSADGSKVFFSSEEHLTGEDEQHTGADIFMWSQKGEEEGKPLTLISKGPNPGIPGEPGNTGDCTPVSDLAHEHWNTVGSTEINCGDVAIGGGGGVAAANGTIYFLSPEKLDGSSNGVQNAPNLYVASPGSAPKFVATLESTLNGPQPPPTYHPHLRNFGSLKDPRFIAVDHSGSPSKGDVYVADPAKAQVFKYSSTGALETSWGEKGHLSGFEEIKGISVDPANGDLYVLAGTGETMYLYNQNGTANTQFNFIYGGEEYGIAVDGAGNFYTVNYTYSNGNVMRFPSGGKIELTSGVRATGLYLDTSDENLYVDNNGEEIYRYQLNGSGEVIEPNSSICEAGCSPDEVVASGLSGGEGVAADSHGVYVAEGNQVLQFAEGNQVGLPIGSGLLGESKSVGLGSTGEVYVANPKQGDIAEFGPSVTHPSPVIENPVVVDSVSSAEARHTADFQVTPDGEFAVFASTLPLTGFESGGLPEVYRYDAAASGSLACASCDPTGVEPTADSELAPDGLSLTNDGRVFFTTAEPLVERDADNRKDVYEWEADGAGPKAAPCETPRGCLGLISTGISSFDSSLLGVSANGTDAYFFTRDKLVPQDENGDVVKIYDARELGGFPYAPPPPPCKASDECHGPSSPLPPPPDIHVNTGTSGSEVPPTNKCKAGFVEKHGKCVKKPKPHKHHKLAAHHKRGGKK